jgi:diadenosine tetraphosphate (Ap4A) HIT family hydrolase
MEKLASQELDTSVEASGPHDFAVRFGAVRYRHFHVHRIPSRVRDDREPPLMWDGMAENIPMI